MLTMGLGKTVHDERVREIEARLRIRRLLDKDALVEPVGHDGSRSGDRPLVLGRVQPGTR